MSKQLREIQARKASLVKEARSITDIAAGEDRDLNDEEVTSFDALRARIDAAIVEAILDDALPSGSSLFDFSDEVPLLWAEQGGSSSTP